MLQKKIFWCALISGCAFLQGCWCQKSDQNAGAKVADGAVIATKEIKMVELPSGLKYEILKAAPEGSAYPQAGKKVVVHYTGWLANEKGEPMLDKKFDSSVDRGQHFQFVIGRGQVIKGWDEGVLSMKVGEKRRLVIPADLAYGTRGAGAKIPGNASLVFDVELFEVQ